MHKVLSVHEEYTFGTGFTERGEHQGQFDKLNSPFVKKIIPKVKISSEYFLVRVV